MSDEATYRLPTKAQLMMPIIALLITGATVATAVLVVASRSLNENVVATEKSLAHTALETQQGALESLAFDYTWWDEVSDNIVDRYDAKWADGNIGSYLTGTYGITHSFVIDAADGTRAAFVDGAPVAGGDALAILPDDVEVLVARARKASYDSPVPHAEFTLIEGVPHLVAVSAITPEEMPDPVPTKTARPVLVLAKAIDDRLLSELGEAYTLEELKLGLSQITT